MGSAGSQEVVSDFVRKVCGEATAGLASGPRLRDAGQVGNLTYRSDLSRGRGIRRLLVEEEQEMIEGIQEAVSRLARGHLMRDPPVKYVGQDRADDDGKHPVEPAVHQETNEVQDEEC